MAFLQGPPLLSDFRFSPLPDGPASSSDVIVQDAFCLLCARCNPKKNYQKTFKFYLIFQSMYFLVIAHFLVLDMVMVIKSYLMLSLLDNNMFESLSKLLSNY